MKRDWEELRDRYSDAVTDPTPSDRNFRRPITNGLWPPRLNNYNIRPAVQEAVRGVARLRSIRSLVPLLSGTSAESRT